MIELYISENKSYDPVRFFRNRVRVFVDRNYDYGLWIDEDRLFELLTPDQKRQYLVDRSPQGMYYQLEPEVAREVVRLGHSPYVKQKIQIKV